MVNFRDESTIVGDWPIDVAGAKFQRMANWPSFDFLIETEQTARNRPPVSYNSQTRVVFSIETGPVGLPLEFEPAKSANPSRLLSKMDQNNSLREWRTFFNDSGRKSLPIQFTAVLKSCFVFTSYHCRPYSFYRLAGVHRHACVPNFRLYLEKMTWALDALKTLGDIM